MAKPAAMTAQTKPGPLQRMQTFWGEVKTELDKVTWPTFADLRVSTNVTMMLIGIIAVLIFAYDWVFQLVVLNLLKFAS